jgi:hypothetical protein
MHLDCFVPRIAGGGWRTLRSRWQPPPPSLTNGGWRTVFAVAASAPPRHCEERSDAAIQAHTRRDGRPSLTEGGAVASVAVAGGRAT